MIRAIVHRIRQFLRRIRLFFHAWLNRLLHRIVDVGGSNEVILVVTREFGLVWVEMETHVEIRNAFFVSYHLEEVRLTYYNDANQNIGHLHFRGPVKIPAYRKTLVKMPSRMSNITALFNGVRLLVSDNVRTRTVGTTRIRLFGLPFEFPIDDVMVISRDKIVTEELTEEEKARRQQEKAMREAERRRKKEARRARRKWKRKARERLQNIRRIRRERSNVPKVGPEASEHPVPKMPSEIVPKP